MQTACEQPRPWPRVLQFDVSISGISVSTPKNGTQDRLACCLFPFFVMRVKFITFSLSACWVPLSSSFSSGLFFLGPGARTAASHNARAVFLSTFLDSADVSVTILASSLANSASASSEGPRLSCKLLLADRITGSSGDGARSSTCDRNDEG